MTLISTGGRSVLRLSLSALLLVSLLGGCADLLRPDSTPIRFYVLSEVSEPTPAVRAVAGPTVAIGTVQLAKQLDRRQIAVRTGPNQLNLAEFDEWAAPLDEHMAMVLAENLTRQIPAARVLPGPTNRAVEVDYRIDANVTAFEWRADEAVVLTSEWSVLDGAGRRELAFGASTFREPVTVAIETASDGSQSIPPESYREIVAAMSRALGGLSAEIAEDIRSLRGRSEASSRASRK